MVETLRHAEAFEYYYTLGDKRNILKVAQKYTVNETAVKKWSIAHNWQQRVAERDSRISAELAKKTEKAVLKSKEDYRREIKDSLTIIRAALQTAVEGLRNKRIRAKTVIDVNSIISMQEKIIKLDLLLMGESAGPDEQPPKLFKMPVKPPARDNGERQALE